MSEKVQLRTAAEIYDNGWKKVEVTITENSIIFGRTQIQFREIQDLEKLEYEGRDAVRIKKDRDFYLNFGNRQQQIFRYLAFNLKSDRFAVYFLSPATRGGVVVSNSKWEKGYLSVTEEAIWFLSPSKQLRISLNNLGSVGKDVRTIGGKQRVVLVVTHVDKGEVITSFVLCPETTLEMLQQYLQKLIDMHKPKEKLSDVEEQIITMVYTGVDSVGIESILGISTEELNGIFDRLIDLGLAKVVKIRKEVELTPRGVALVNEIMKKAAK
jgi:hypothetical protein